MLEKYTSFIVIFMSINKYTSNRLAFFLTDFESAYIYAGHVRQDQTCSLFGAVGWQAPSRLPLEFLRFSASSVLGEVSS